MQPDGLQIVQRRLRGDRPEIGMEGRDAHGGFPSQQADMERLMVVRMDTAKRTGNLTEVTVRTSECSQRIAVFAA
jgi:hypothetical protein